MTTSPKARGLLGERDVGGPRAPSPAGEGAARDLELALLALAVAPWLGEGLCVAAALVLAACLARRPRGRLRAAAAGVPALAAVCGALGAAALAATLAAVGGPLGLRPAALGRLLPQLALPGVAVAARLAGPRATLQACRAFVAAGLLATAFGLTCWASGWSPALAYPRLQAANGQSFVPGTSLPVAGGLLGHRLKQAHLLLVVTVPMAVGLFTCGRRGRVRAVALAAVAAVGLAGTYARAAAVAATAGVAALALLRLPRRWAARAACGAAVAAGAAWWASRPKLSALLGAGGERPEIWRQAGAICRDYPLGVGLGNYPRVVGAYYDLEAPLSAAPRTAPHGLLLSALVEGGPVALVATLVAFGSLAARGFGAQRAASVAERQAGLGAVQLVTALLVAGLGHDVLYHGVVGWAAWAAAGLALAGCVPATGRAGEGASTCV